MYGYIYLDLPQKNQPNVGKYTSPMDGMGKENPLKQTSMTFAVHVVITA